MPELQTPSTSCPLCGATAYEPEVMTRADGSSSEGWFRCVKCKRYTVNPRATKPHVSAYTKPIR